MLAGKISNRFASELCLATRLASRAIHLRIAGVHHFTATDLSHKNMIFGRRQKLKMRAFGYELYVFSDHVGEEFVPVITNGDGACSLHSVFGIPTFNRRTGATEMYCSDARSVPAKLFGAGLQSVRERVSQKDLLQAVETSLFADVCLDSRADK